MKIKFTAFLLSSVLMSTSQAADAIFGVGFASQVSYCTTVEMEKAAELRVVFHTLSEVKAFIDNISGVREYRILRDKFEEAIAKRKTEKLKVFTPEVLLKCCKKRFR